MTGQNPVLLYMVVNQIRWECSEETLFSVFSHLADCSGGTLTQRGKLVLKRNISSSFGKLIDSNKQILQ